MNSLWTSKQDPVSGIVSTILQDMSADGNCISAELDQFLSEPLISHQDDPASWWNMNMLCCHHSYRNSWHHHLPHPSREALQYSWWHYIWLSTAVVFYPKMQRHWSSWSSTATSWACDISISRLMLEWLIWLILALILLHVKFLNMCN